MDDQFYFSSVSIIFVKREVTGLVCFGKKHVHWFITGPDQWLPGEQSHDHKMIINRKIIQKIRTHFYSP